MHRDTKTEIELWRSIRIMASNIKRIKERLAAAYEYHFIYVKPGSMPTSDMRKKVEYINDRLTAKQTKPVIKAIHHWPLKSCCKIALDICDIYDEHIHFEWNSQNGRKQH